jgi:hypothetical protein
MHKVLSLDVSSTTIGWSLISESEGLIKVIKHGHIKPPKSDLSLARRALKSQYLLKSLIKDLKPEDVLIAVPSLDDYAPLVPAVFHTKENPLPVRLTELPASEGDEVLEGLSPKACRIL